MPRILILILAILHVAPVGLSGQNPAPKHQTTTDVLGAVKIASDYMSLKSAVYSVEGEKTIDGNILATELLQFQPGSKLVFGKSANSGQDIYIIATTIKILPGSPAPIITWRPEPLDPPLPLDGKGPPGEMGSSEGSSGLQGLDGQIGYVGLPGHNGPTVYLFVNHIEGGSITVDVSGQEGGKGGKGQKGGDGGIGRIGRTGISSLFDCRAGGGNGGDGGRGGNGGRGGTGGRGGNGGTLVIVSSGPTLDSIQNVVRVRLDGGSGGAGGSGGDRGSGGPQGQGGNGSGFCQGGHPGQPGSTGDDGHTGDPGSLGVPGVWALVPIAGQQGKTLGIS
jgi:hypothetical protein